ncbi:lipopolysaccharide transport periplasmic protein LptA [Pseudooceanicola aestuarii]|uniref:lipopolysaccharide transport periplasmic protein LptA n=1 Tax=Pseudooceanicola aestuarii TaxID=2697319 RepID=UPI0013D3242D|nr:lipopolysaccharide transport periplasmic protein LptA [Pseudooceanicola aestuarii]
MLLRFLILTLLALAPVMASAPAMAQGANIAFGQAREDRDAPVEVEAENLSVDQNDGTAIFTGNVIIVQGEMRMTAPRVRIVYDEDGARVEEMRATGGVTLVSGPDAAEADSADYNIDRGDILMRGNVLLAQGQNTFASDRMAVNLDAGTAQLQGRVRTVLQSE